MRARHGGAQVELVGQQDHRDVGRQQVQHLGIGQVEAAGFDHEQDQIHIGHGTEHRLVQCAVERVAVQGLKTRRVHEHELVRAFGAVASDAVARGLRLARGDADLLPDQRIEQR